MSPDAGPIGNTIVTVLLWLFRHGAQLVPWMIVLCVLVALTSSALLWFQSGARYFWAWRQWQRAWSGRAPFHPGGAGGHTSEYRAVMQSSGWRRRRAHAIRRAGGRCQHCGAGGSLDVHHTTYAHLGNERPYELAVLCPGCHRRAHATA
jgi:hypothetical protein